MRKFIVGFFILASMAQAEFKLQEADAGNVLYDVINEGPLQNTVVISDTLIGKKKTTVLVVTEPLGIFGTDIIKGYIKIGDYKQEKLMWVFPSMDGVLVELTEKEKELMKEDTMFTLYVKDAIGETHRYEFGTLGIDFSLLEVLK